MARLALGSHLGTVDRKRPARIVEILDPALPVEIVKIVLVVEAVEHSQLIIDLVVARLLDEIAHDR
jgi:hypothetical protein